MSELQTPHVFSVSIAKIVGVEAAVIYQNLMYWCKQNEANVLWGTLFCVSPAIWLVLTMLFFGFNFKKDENESSLEDDLRSF